MTDTFPRSRTPAAGAASDAGSAGSQARTIADSEATTAFREHIARVNTNAEDRAIARQHAKGKQTARERIEGLLDAGTFLEIGRYTGSGAGSGARPSGVGWPSTPRTSPFPAERLARSRATRSSVCSTTLCVCASP